VFRIVAASPHGLLCGSGRARTRSAFASSSARLACSGAAKKWAARRSGAREQTRFDKDPA